VGDPREYLKRLDDNRFVIERHDAMRVDGIIYIDEELLKEFEKDESIKQVENVACLPGIVGDSMAMPDIHWGYGFPIGGVAAFDVAKGIISPGGVGYDINCLTENAKVLHKDGYFITIKDCEEKWEKLVCFNKEKTNIDETEIVRFIKRRSEKDILLMTTETGYEIKVTDDHPMWSLNGNIQTIEAKNFKEGDFLIIYPFKGVPYEEPKDDIILDLEEFKKIAHFFNKGDKGNALVQILKECEKRNLFPLRYNSPNLPEIIKLMGYIFGDGSITFFERQCDFLISFFGNPEDLEDIQKDLDRLGFKAGIYHRERKQTIETEYARYDFETRTSICKNQSSSLALLLIALGTPWGDKTCHDFKVPEWLFKAPLWQKRLFLASFFGAEMSTPRPYTHHGYNFYSPVVSMNKKPSNAESGKDFLRDLSLLLEEAGVKTNKIPSRIERIGKDKKPRMRTRLILSTAQESLLNLYERVGFEYNRKKTFFANLCAHYIRKKSLIIEERKKSESIAHCQKQEGCSLEQIFANINSPWVNKRFIERSLYEGRKTAPRISSAFGKFTQYMQGITQNLKESGFVFDKIVRIEKISNTGYVYDFTVAHHDHNFIANNFLVSNCGVRLMRSGLSVEEIRGRIREIIDRFYINIPSGLGSHRKDLKLSRNELEKVLKKGAEWAVHNGYGTEEDLGFIEDSGRIEHADPQNVSERAYERGKDQLGTVGSGNHFVEIGYIKEIYDGDIARVFGLYENQVTVMIHTGSRGLGYQVCDDYIREMIKASERYGISLPDRQLCCAPLESAEGQRYLGAMASAANYAFANRQMITHWVRETLEGIFRASARSLDLSLVYDVCHNIAKIEKHRIKGKESTVCVHRKGATRSFSAGNPAIPGRYMEVGQPVLIPGDMGRASYVLCGTKRAMEETFGSTCHGAGRVMSRHQAIKVSKGRSISKEMEAKGVYVRAASRETLAEEMPEAYKDVSKVVRVVHNAGISKLVAKIVPLGSIKG